MVKIEKESYGFYVTVAGSITNEEMETWLEDSKKLMPAVSGKFCVFVDMINCETLPDEAEKIMGQMQELYMMNGLERAAVVTKTLEMDLQPKIKNACIESGVYDMCRYIDIKTTPDWKKKANEWIRKGIEPYQ
jgi:hypothetical protein